MVQTEVRAAGGPQVPVLGDGGGHLVSWVVWEGPRHLFGAGRGLVGPFDTRIDRNPEPGSSPGRGAAPQVTAHSWLSQAPTQATAPEVPLLPRWGKRGPELEGTSLRPRPSRPSRRSGDSAGVGLPAPRALLQGGRACGDGAQPPPPCRGATCPCCRSRAPALLPRAAGSPGRLRRCRGADLSRGSLPPAGRVPVLLPGRAGVPRKL